MLRCSRTCLYSIQDLPEDTVVRLQGDRRRQGRTTRPDRQQLQQTRTPTPGDRVVHLATREQQSLLFGLRIRDDAAWTVSVEWIAKGFLLRHACRDLGVKT